MRAKLPPLNWRLLRRRMSESVSPCVKVTLLRLKLLNRGLLRQHRH
jgi:hypothetical protein